MPRVGAGWSGRRWQLRSPLKDTPLRTSTTTALSAAAAPSIADRIRLVLLGQALRVRPIAAMRERRQYCSWSCDKWRCAADALSRQYGPTWQPEHGSLPLLLILRVCNWATFLFRSALRKHVAVVVVSLSGASPVDCDADLIANPACFIVSLLQCVCCFLLHLCTKKAPTVDWRVPA